METLSERLEVEAEKLSTEMICPLVGLAIRGEFQLMFGGHQLQTKVSRPDFEGDHPVKQQFQHQAGIRCRQIPTISRPKGRSVSAPAPFFSQTVTAVMQ